MSVYLYPGGYSPGADHGRGGHRPHQHGVPGFPPGCPGGQTLREKVVYYGLIWIILAGILLFMPKYRKIGVAVLAGLVLEVICCNLVLKPLVARIRPCDVNTAVQLLIARPDDFSFPSGHTGASFAAVTALYASRSRLWIPSLILAVLIAFSRLYLYVHYPSDVLAGVVIGIMAGWIGSKLVDVVWRKRNAA